MPHAHNDLVALHGTCPVCGKGKAKPNKNIIHVGGNHGNLEVDADTGAVLSYEYEGFDSDGYKIIVRFDVAEFRQAYPNEDIVGTYVDILDIGYWYSKGDDGELGYEPPIRDRIEQVQAKLAANKESA